MFMNIVTDLIATLSTIHSKSWFMILVAQATLEFHILNFVKTLSDGLISISGNTCQLKMVFLCKTQFEIKGMF